MHLTLQPLASPLASSAARTTGICLTTALAFLGSVSFPPTQSLAATPCDPGLGVRVEFYPQAATRSKTGHPSFDSAEPKIYRTLTTEWTRTDHIRTGLVDYIEDTSEKHVETTSLDPGPEKPCPPSEEPTGCPCHEPIIERSEWSGFSSIFSEKYDFQLASIRTDAGWIPSTPLPPGLVRDLGITDGQTVFSHSSQTTPTTLTATRQANAPQLSRSLNETTRQTLSDEYTTSQLISKTRESLANQSPPDAPPWTQNRTVAFFDLAPSTKCLTIQNVQFRFSLPASERDASYRISWDEVTLLKEPRSIRSIRKSLILNGTGAPVLSPIQKLTPPDADSEVSVESVHIALEPKQPGKKPGSGAPLGISTPSGTGTGCASCTGTSASPVASSAPSFFFPLGTDADGNNLGELVIAGAHPTPTLAQPAGLSYNGSSEFVQLTTVNGVLSQIRTPAALVKVQSSDPFSYSIEFYSQPTTPPTLISRWLVQNVNQTTETCTHLRVERTSPSPQSITDFIQDPATGEWTISLTGIDGAQAMTTLILPNNDRVHTGRIIDASGRTLFQRRQVYHRFDWGDALVEESIGTNADEQTTRYVYDLAFPSNAQISGSFQPLRQTIHPSGLAETYTYDDQGRRVAIHTPFLGSPRNQPNPTLKVTRFNYTSPPGSDDSQDHSPLSPRLITEEIGGTEVSRRYHIEREQETLDIRCTTPGAPWNDAANLTTITRRYSEGFHASKVRSIEFPDGTMIFHNYAETAAGNTHTQTEGAPNTTKSAIHLGRETITETDASGQLQRRTVRAITEGLPGDILESQVSSLPDPLGRPTRTTYLDGSYSEVLHDCCHLASTTDREGVTTLFTYDPAGRLISSKTAGIESRNVYDDAGNIIERSRWAGTEGGVIWQGRFNTAGELIEETNPLGGRTTYSRTFDPDGNEVSTTTFPDGSTHSEIYHPSGLTKAIHGTRTSPIRFEHSVVTVNGIPMVTTKEIQLSPTYADTPEWTTAYHDPAGRLRRTVHSGPGTPTTELFYDLKGRVWKETHPNGVVKLLEYDALGRRSGVAIDVNRNDSIDLAGPDRLVRTVRSFGRKGDVPIERTTTLVWKHPNTTPTETSVHESALDRSQAWITAAGTTTHTRTTLQRQLQQRVVTVTRPDLTQEITTFTEGRMENRSTRTADLTPISQEEFAYDALGRLKDHLDPTGTRTSFTYNAADQRLTSTVHGPNSIPIKRSNTYNAALQLIRETLPDGSHIDHKYHPSGHLALSFGSQTYPAGFGYDSQGRITSMTNWTTFSPTPGGPRITRWEYHDQTGTLSRKVYPDGSATEFTYTQGGLLATRQQARKRTPGAQEQLTTTYTYGNAGELLSITHNDGTPGTTFTYDRAGRTTEAFHNASTTRFSYNPADQPVSEQVIGGPLDGLELQRTFTTHNKLAGLTLRNAGSTLGSTRYAYGPSGILTSVADDRETADYQMDTAGTRIQALHLKRDGLTRLTTERVYDPAGRLVTIASTPSSGSPFLFGYRYSAANQREQVTLADDSRWQYAYDSLGQLTSASKRTAAGTPSPGTEFRYQFDSIGNRTTTQRGGDINGTGLRTSSYQANVLNQYTSRSVPGTADILGIAHRDAAVTINGTAATRQRELFHGSVSADNTQAPAWLNSQVQALWNGAVKSDAGTVYIPKTPELFSHDEDGNLISDGRWLYTWDAENRLTKLEPRPEVPNGARFRIEFSYDWQGRRTMRHVTSLNGSSSTVLSTSRFVYDVWNPIAELDDSRQLTRWNVWGLDLSHTFQGAGGVGGLLWTRPSGANAQFVAYDGNGNVAGLVDSVTGSPTAHYEYGPFGEPLRATGPHAETNPFRFSTKPHDPHSGFAYYGYRYYNPDTGRWLNRDPIGEKGGMTLHGFVHNSPINRADTLGLFSRGYHLSITKQGLSKFKLQHKCLDEIINANLGQDKGFFPSRPPFSDPLNHGDNSLLAPTIQLLFGRVSSAANRPCGDCKSILESLKDFGKAIHALQDLYSHSNYVEAYGSDVERPSDLPLWTMLNKDGTPNVPAGLSSGFYPNDSNQPGESHARMNHDDPTQVAAANRNKELVRFFDIAESAATRHTEQLWDYFRSRLSGQQRSQLQQCCQ